MVEITAEEQNKGKRMKRIENSLRDLWDNIKCTSIQIIGVPEEKEKKVYEKIFEDIAIEYFPNMGKEIVNQVQEVQSPIYDKRRKKHAKIHTNQTNKYLAQRKNIESSKRKTTSNIQGKALYLTADLSAETL